MTSLARQHFQQTVDAIKSANGLKFASPAREIKLAKKNPKFKTVFLDLDETLIHCDENSNNYTVKLDFPIEGGNIVSVFIIFYTGRSKSSTTLSRGHQRTQYIRINNNIHSK